MGNILRLSRKWMILSALVLLAVSGYELITRLDVLTDTFGLVADIVTGEAIPLERAAGYIWQRRRLFEVPLFLLLSVLAAIAGLLVRTSRRGCMVLFPAALAIAVWGLFVDMTALGEMLRFARLFPMLALSILSCVNVFVQPAQRARLRTRALKIGQSAGYAPANVAPPPAERRLKRGEMPLDYPYAEETQPVKPSPLPAVREKAAEKDTRRFRYGIADHPKRSSRRRAS